LPGQFVMRLPCPWVTSAPAISVVLFLFHERAG
jgi:hypothetical protein